MNIKSLNELKRNTLIIAVSNLGSKAISFILAPLYSYYLTVAEYGRMDLIMTTASLLLPFLCLGIFESTFRYASDAEYDSKTVLSSTLSVCIIEAIIVIVPLFLIYWIQPFPLSIGVCVIAAVLDSFYQVLQQYARGKGNMIIFAFGGVLSSVVLFIFNLFMLVFLHLGLNGWIYSFLGAKLIPIIYLLVKLDTRHNFQLSCIRMDFLKEALKFCLPLVPGAAMWWIMNASDRYVISFALGVSATGIFAVASKLPALLSIFENVFYQAWQTTAINTLNKSGRDQIYSEVLWNYFKFLSIGVMGLLVILKPMIVLLFAEDYYPAYVPAAVLIIGVMIHALAGNLGTLYNVFKNTTGAFKTAGIGAALNLILNVLFIPVFGLPAAAWTTVLGYIVVTIIRWYDVKHFVILHLPRKEFCMYASGISLQLILYYIPGIPSYIIRILIFSAFLYYNKNQIIRIIKKK